MQRQDRKHPQKIFQPIKIVFPEFLADQKVKQIYACSNRSYAIFKELVLTWGQKIYQQNEDYKQQTEDEGYVQVIPIQVKQLARGGHHTFAYTKSIQVKSQKNMKIQNLNYKVYCWGSNLSYELGLEEEINYGLVKVDLFDQAFQSGFLLNQIACGDNHTLALFKDQQNGQTKLFGWGQSKSYQLALDTTGIIPYPVEIQNVFDSSIQKIQSRSDYNVIILQNGQIYSWGSNMFNRLGINQSKLQKLNHNTSRDTHKFSKQMDNQDSTTQRSLRSNENNKIQKLKIPRKIDIFNKKIISVALGLYHVIALSIQGQCYTWGNGIYGQLGNNKYGECQPDKITTVHLSGNPKFVKCSAGEQHSCILDKQGYIYTCGSNSFGVLGHKKHENQSKKKRCKIFEKVDFFQQNQIKIKQISSGNRHIFVKAQNSQIYGWGSNQNNQILFKQNKNIQKNKLKQPFLVRQSANKNLRRSRQFQKLYESDRNQNKLGGILNQKQILNNLDQNTEKMVNHNDDLSQKDSNQLNHVTFLQKIHSNGSYEFSQTLKQQKQLEQNALFKKLNRISQKININELKNWRVKYENFIIQKRRQEDELIKQFDLIFQKLSLQK